MEFKSTNMVNFVRLEGADTTINIGALNERDFSEWLSQYCGDLKRHWLKRRALYIKESPATTGNSDYTAALREMLNGWNVSNDLLINEQCIRELAARLNAAISKLHCA